MGRKVFVVIAIIVALNLITVSVIIFGLLEGGSSSILDGLLPDNEYIIDIDRNFTTPEEGEALNVTEELPLGSLLNTTRYRGGDALNSEKKEILFIDSNLIDEGTAYVKDRKSSGDSGRYSFEYKASCRKINEMEVKVSPMDDNFGFMIEIDHPDLEKLESFWAQEPPYSAYYHTGPLDPCSSNRFPVYQNGFLNDTSEKGSTTYSFGEVYFVQMLVELGSSHRGGLGNGYVTYQYIMLDMELNPILIIAETSEWEA